MKPIIGKTNYKRTIEMLIDIINQSNISRLVKNHAPSVLRDSIEFYYPEEKEKEIIYFIMAHTIEKENGEKVFEWPCLPDPKMGKKFINKIKKQHEEIAHWARFEPDKFELAQKGYYSKSKLKNEK